MDKPIPRHSIALSRRRLITTLGAGSAAIATAPLWAQGAAGAMRDLLLPGKPSQRAMTTAFPEKGEMILQRTRAVGLETPMEVFNQGVFTPNDRFFVRWHWPIFHDTVSVKDFTLRVHGAVEKEITLSLDNLLNDFERIEYAAVNQCSGNSRGTFYPSLPGAEWGHGAMGNAKWTGVRLKDVLDKAGVKADAVDVRMGGLDDAMMPDAPKFRKSLAVDHARDGEVMIAFAMNGEQLPILNGFPLRVIVPGWFSTYWIKALNDIEVLDHKDDQFWMAKAYMIPDTAHANIVPGTKDFPKKPISKMVPRSFVTNLTEGQKVPSGKLNISGIAMGGATGVAKVELSTDGGKSWIATTLGKDEGKYSFRRFAGQIDVPQSGEVKLITKCTNSDGEAQTLQKIWNPGGYQQIGVETLTLKVGDA